MSNIDILMTYSRAKYSKFFKNGLEFGIELKFDILASIEVLVKTVTNYGAPGII